MSKLPEITGEVIRVLGHGQYMVEISQGEKSKEVLCRLAGRMERYKIRVITGDKVKIELSPPYDKGRITFRGVARQ